MTVLDTNVISALMAGPRNTPVVDWLDAQPAASVWTTSIRVLEIRFGIERNAHGRRREALARALEDILGEELDGPERRHDRRHCADESSDSRNAQCPAFRGRRNSIGKPLGGLSGAHDPRRQSGRLSSQSRILRR